MNRRALALVLLGMHDQLSLPALAGEPGPRAELRDATVTVAFLLAGNAIVTFQSRKTGVHFTYRIRQAEPRPGDTREPPHFVSVLTGPDNGASYEYLGCIFGRRAYSHGAKSRVSREAPSAVAFTWAWARLSGGAMPADLAVWHEGRCGRCGRRLTDPASIEAGMGSTCRGRAS